MFESFKGIFKGIREKIEEPKKEGQENMQAEPGPGYKPAEEVKKEWEERKKQDPNAWREQK